MQRGGIGWLYLLLKLPWAANLWSVPSQLCAFWKARTAGLNPWSHTHTVSTCPFLWFRVRLLVICWLYKELPRLAYPEWYVHEGWLWSPPCATGEQVSWLQAGSVIQPAFQRGFSKRQQPWGGAVLAPFYKTLPIFALATPSVAHGLIYCFLFHLFSFMQLWFLGLEESPFLFWSKAASLLCLKSLQRIHLLSKFFLSLMILFSSISYWSVSLPACAFLHLGLVHLL